MGHAEREKLGSGSIASVSEVGKATTDVAGPFVCIDNGMVKKYKITR